MLVQQISSTFDVMAARVDGDVEPTAPPAWMVSGPPTYDAVANQDRSRGQTLRRREQFAESLQTAGEYQPMLEHGGCGVCLFV